MQQYDIVIYGATSFAGQYITQHLINHRAKDLKLNIAIAGRDQNKLDSLATKLTTNVDTLCGEADDQTFISNMVASAKVIISTVGPYALYGETLIAKVAAQGKAYCDLTGEPQWIWLMLNKYEQIAKQNGARIVHCSGFDSIPSDLGVWHLQQQAKQRYQSYCENIHYRFNRYQSRGGFSGGTAATMLTAIEHILEDREKARILKTPYALISNKDPSLPYQKSLRSIAKDKDTGQYLTPFIMASINTKIVHRSNALLDYPWGKHFLYDESMNCGSGLKGYFRALSFMAGLSLFGLLASTRWGRTLLKRHILPKQGDGPEEELVVNGYFTVDMIGTTNKGQKIKTKITGRGDPGYGSTSKMITEVALLLLNNDIAPGFITPAAAFQNDLLNNLMQHADVNFTVQE